MRHSVTRLIDYFIPIGMRENQANLMKVRTFVLLHLLGPAMGHSVVLFLWTASKVITWQFCVVEAGVAFFWLIPILIKVTRSLVVPATLSVQGLVFLSLFGSFCYGGISSPFMPWLLIALLLGFFYLAENAVGLLVGVAAQLGVFIAARLVLGSFPSLLPPSSLTYVNLISIVVAVAYTTLLSLYYETVMRDSGMLEQATHDHRARMEALGEAMRRAELASRQKSIFLAKISHELRTPLNAVIGYSEMLRDELPPESAQSQRATDLERINTAGRHLLALVTDVLDLTIIEAEKLNASLETIEVKEIIQDVAATAAPLVGKKHNRLITKIDDQLGLIETDPLKLRQCILNLLSNAAKFTSHGTILLDVRKAQKGATASLIIEVSDTGIGMSPESLTKIFKNFSQAELGTTQEFGGTGLGLALTQRFCALMGGSISVTSVPGKGSTFTIELPCTRSAGQTADSQSRVLANVA